MRSSALLLIVALTAPSVVTAVCEVLCATHAHQAAAAVASSPCHEHHVETHGPAIEAGAAACHDTTDLLSNALTVASQDAPAPALVTPLITIAAPANFLAVHGWQWHARPPDRGSTRAPLRV